MKVHPECFQCMFRALSKEARLFEVDGVEFATEVLKRLVDSLESIRTPADMAYIRELVLKELTKSEDPFAKLKAKRMESVTRDIATLVRKELENLPEGYHKFRWLSLNAASINGYEAPLHSEGLIEKFLDTVSRGLGVDDTEKAFDIITKIKRGGYVAYILDNAHEFPVDRLLIRYIMGFGRTVYVFAREKPIADDITKDEVRKLDPELEIFSLKTPLGVKFELEHETNRRILENADLIISKGMANYETLTEYEANTPTLFLLTAKCTPVAEELGVERGTPVALLR